MRRQQTRALTIIAFAQLLALSLWFSASAVAPQLHVAWGLDSAMEAWLTLAVQLGFVTGAVLSAVLNVADVIPGRRLFAASAMGGALANLALLSVDATNPWVGIALRFGTGVFLAGVYPAGLKVLSGWFREGRGRALGVMVGALTIGTASPHLVRGLGLDWRGVVVASSAFAFLAAGLLSRVGDGPYETSSQPFRWDQVSRVVGNRGVRLSTYGYLGHMWELYAMWTWIAVYLTASSDISDSSYGSIPMITFFVIAVGGLGSWWAGSLADRIGRTRVAGGALVISGICSVATAAIFGSPVWLILPIVLIWGVSIVADSAQFSTMVTETAPDEVRGTALTLQTALGFLLTMATIKGVPVIADAIGWRWAFPILALGPVLGVIAMIRLARSSMSVQLAGGRG